MKNIHLLPTDEPKQYPIGGYAPGYYSCTCVTCKKEFTGDKRAVQCKPCAIQMTREEPKQETIEEAAVDYISEKSERAREYGMVFNAIRFGAKWQAERRYSEEEVLVLLHKRDKHNMDNPNTFNGWLTPKEWFKQFKKK
jgi:hypothetical protein